MSKRMTLLATALFCALPARAQLSPNLQDWMHRLNAGEFGGGGGRGGRGAGPAPGRWIEGGKAYVVTERGAPVRIDTATGARQPLPPEPGYRPPQLDHALTNPTLSADGNK